MKLNKVKILNFRSIKEASASIHSITALIGENNSGKSTFLRALNVFFNYEEEEKDFKSGNHFYFNSQSIPTIILEFSIPNKKNRLEINKILKICKNETECNELQELRIKFRYRKEMREISIMQERWILIKDQKKIEKIISKIKDITSFVYIPPTREPDKIAWKEKSLLYECVKIWFNQNTKKRDTISSSFNKPIEILSKKKFPEIANLLASYYLFKNDFNFKIDFTKTINYKHFLTAIELKYEEVDREYGFDNVGSGTQSLTIIALYCALAELEGKSVLLCLEEPEKNLHPQAQKDFITLLQNKIDEKKISQVIFTTHSSVITESLELDTIKLFRKEKKDELTKSFFYTKINETNSDLRKSKHISNYYYHNYNFSEIFYARIVVIVEGFSDVECFKILMKMMDIDISRYGISFLALNGCGNYAQIVSIIKNLEIPHLVILDMDSFTEYKKDSNGNHIFYADGFRGFNPVLSNNTYIKTIFDEEKLQTQAVAAFKKSYTELQEFFNSHNIVILQHNLETDLFMQPKAPDLFWKFCAEKNVNDENKIEHKAKILFTNHRKKMKHINCLLYVINELKNIKQIGSLKIIKKYMDTIIDKQKIK